QPPNRQGLGLPALCLSQANDARRELRCAFDRARPGAGIRRHRPRDALARCGPSPSSMHRGLPASHPGLFTAGIYGTVVVQACLVLLSKKRRGVRGSQVNLAAVIAMFAIATVQWALDLAGFIIEGKMTLIENPDADIGVKYGDASGVIFKIVAAQAAIYGYMVGVARDAIIIHRAWKLKATHHVWIFAVPCLLWLGSVVATLLLTYCVATIGSDIVLGNFTHPAFCRNVQLVTYVMPCATTAVATALIGAMALKFARTRKSIGHVDRVSSVGTVHKSPAWYVLLLLVESGVLYFLFFLIQVIEVAPVVHNWLAANAGLSLAFKMFVYASSVFIGIYPTILIVLAHSRYA
ncbi:unnamed protein product, partial [Mycena citricolor]